MDLNVTAFRIVQRLSQENKNDNRSQSARIAGKIGGPARAEKLTAEERREIALKANKARWGKYRSGSQPADLRK
jgi:hypothetical protein